ncbi:MAG: DUF3520 domain-containing protein [Pedobacter sp.]|nr:MAG: DUF3520 domain-containing protein [Pedobacter sp.]
MKRVLIPLLILLVAFGFKNIQFTSITGKVISEDTGNAISAATVQSLPSKKTTKTGPDGTFKLSIPETDTHLRISSAGHIDQSIKLGKQKTYSISLKTGQMALKETLIMTTDQAQYHTKTGLSHSIIPQLTPSRNIVQNESESYTGLTENGFNNVLKNPLSTFSIDVDAASYSNMRRFINNGNLPPKDAVRIEEMINYFDYDYPQPTDAHPINIISELAPAPWNTKHRLLKVGLKAKTLNTENLPASNLVFLIDVSGSMNAANKLPLLVSSFKLLTDQLRSKDKVAIVVYAGSSGLVLPSTSGDAKTTIKDALNKLSAGGSTAGGQGLELAYKVAQENFIKGGNNRIILATDGDFNVGASSDADMQRKIEEKRKTGIYLTVLGYGMGNYKDSKMEILADKGNGNYAYIDNINEARKVLVNEFGGTLFTVAKDVKLQLEFNPSKVQAYRLIGYENRMLKDEDFNNDLKDAGEMGSGHTVIALYEIIPTGVTSSFANSVDDLKYQTTTKPLVKSAGSELLTLKLRYKLPNETVSKRIEKIVLDREHVKTSDNFRFAAAVAEFGMLLRNSEYKQNSGYDELIELASSALGKDKEGYRSEFLKLAKSTKLMARDLLTIAEGKEKD